MFGIGSEAPPAYLLMPANRDFHGGEGALNGVHSHLLARGLGVCRAVHIPADECIDRGVNNGCQIYCCSKNKPFVKARITQGCQQLEATPPWDVTWLYLSKPAGWDGSSTGI